ncbi:hypothetical protein ACWCOW_42890, partial [Streptomyces sp. NPDC001939]
MPTTLITTPTFARHSTRPWQILDEAGAGPLRPCEDAALPIADLLKYAPEADALIVGMDAITAEVMDASPRLKVIAKHGVNAEHVLAAAKFFTDALRILGRYSEAYELDQR